LNVFVVEFDFARDLPQGAGWTFLTGERYSTASLPMCLAIFSLGGSAAASKPTQAPAIAKLRLRGGDHANSSATTPV
jgi:hypothetical protein